MPREPTKPTKPTEPSEINSHASAAQADGTPLPTPLEVASAKAASPAGAVTGPPASAGSDATLPGGPASAPADATDPGRWLRPPDVAHVRSEIEHQIRAKPGRALLVALGVGYVIGRIFRGKRET